MQRLGNNHQPPPSFSLPIFGENGRDGGGSCTRSKPGGTRKQTSGKTQSTNCHSAIWTGLHHHMRRGGMVGPFIASVGFPYKQFCVDSNRIRRFGRKPRFQSQLIHLHHLPNLKPRRRRSCFCNPQLSQLKRQRHCPLKLPFRRRTRNHLRIRRCRHRRIWNCLPPHPCHRQQNTESALLPAPTSSGSISMSIVPDTPTAGGSTNVPLPTAESTPETEIPPQVTSNGERWIDVNLTQQMVYAYQGNSLANSFLVSTGTWQYPTVTGQYHIYIKLRYTDMTGPGYYLPNVPFTMYFYQGYGLARHLLASQLRHTHEPRMRQSEHLQTRNGSIIGHPSARWSIFITNFFVGDQDGQSTFPRHVRSNPLRPHRHRRTSARASSMRSSWRFTTSRSSH